MSALLQCVYIYFVYIVVLLVNVGAAGVCEIDNKFDDEMDKSKLYYKAV